MAAHDIEALKAMGAAELAVLLAPGSPDRTAVIRTAAEGGLADAQAALGQMLLDGDGVDRDQRAAIGWFHKAAGQGHVMAINMIGRCFDLGWGVAIDKARAAEWFKAAADRGLDWGMYNYATLLALGQGVAEDKPAALAWLRKAAALGNAKAINFVGSFYEDGWVVERDLAAAADHYRRAAEGGDFRGQFNHARMLADGGDIDAALAWLARIGETATPAFLDKAEHWLRGSPLARLRGEGVSVLRGSVRQDVNDDDRDTRRTG
jgi:TPR repeat protein